MVHGHLQENLVWALTLALGVLLALILGSGARFVAGPEGAALVLGVAMVPWIALQRR